MNDRNIRFILMTLLAIHGSNVSLQFYGRSFHKSDCSTKSSQFNVKSFYLKIYDREQRVQLLKAPSKQINILHYIYMPILLHFSLTELQLFFKWCEHREFRILIELAGE